MDNKNEFNDNILPDILLLEKNIPENVSPLEKVRWVYINLGKLFSYDYRVATDSSYAFDKYIDMNKYVNRYETCLQVCEVLDHILNKIEGVTSTTVERSLHNVRGNYGQEHVGNLVDIEDNGISYHLILDLTLDLYLIQSDCKTMHFGYQDDGTGTCDIISQMENEKMDIKLGFINNYKDYTDYQISLIKENIKQINKDNISPEEYINLNLSLIHGLNKKFDGYHEGIQYTNLLFKELLDIDYKEFNLYYESEDNLSMKSIYLLEYQGVQKWIVYSNKFGYIPTDLDHIRELLDHEWFTRSETLLNMVYETKKR